MADRKKIGKASRNKGRRVELEFVHELEVYGVPSRRRQASGDSRSEDDPDILIAGCLTAESKARKNGEGFKTLQDWLGDSDLLFLKQNHKPAMVVMTMDTFKPMLLAWYEQKCSVPVLPQCSSVEV